MTKSTGREGWARPVLGGRRATSRPREAVQGHGGAGRKLQAVGFDDPAVLRHRPLPAESERPGLTRPPRPAPLRGSLLPLGQARAAPLVCQRQRPEGPRPLPGGRGRGAALPADTASSVPVGEAAEPQARGEAPTTHTPPHQMPQETQTDSQDAQTDAPQRPATAQARTRHPQTDPHTDTHALGHTFPPGCPLPAPAAALPTPKQAGSPAAGCGFLGNAVTVTASASQSPEGLQHVPDEPPRAYLELRLQVGAGQRPMRCLVGGRGPRG